MDNWAEFEPVVKVRAWRVTTDNIDRVADWCDGHVYRNFIAVNELLSSNGPMAYVGDYVVKAVNGDFTVVAEADFRRYFQRIVPQGDAKC